MKYPVSNEQLQIVVGSILGDGCFVRSQARSGNTSIRWRHCAEQAPYLEWKDSKMGDLRGSGVKWQKGSGYSTKDVCYAVSKYSNRLNPFYELVGTPKRITRKLLNLLDPLGLAVWYMDDGSLDMSFYVNKHGVEKVARRRAILCTNSFSLEEHYIMQQYFKTVWGLEVSIHKSKPGQYRLCFNRTNTEKLFSIIDPFIHTSMRYKVALERSAKLVSS